MSPNSVLRDAGTLPSALMRSSRGLLAMVTSVVR